MNSFSDYGPPHRILILAHSAIESRYSWEIMALLKSSFFIIIFPDNGDLDEEIKMATFVL